MAVRKINESTLTAIGNAIRSKTGGSALINPEDMADEIDSIQTGGGTGDNVVLALPDGYKVVNCVSIPFGGYVNTLIIPSGSNDFYLDARADTPVSSVVGSAILFGCRYGDIVCNVGVFQSFAGFLFQILQQNYYQVATKDNQRHVFQAKDSGHYCFVDSSFTTGAVGSQTATNSILIAARQTSDGNGVERHCAMTVWRYTHTIGATKRIDLIPCQRKSDGQYGFFDLVSASFFGNSGTGTFTEGVE